jgi:hypothetical protein
MPPETGRSSEREEMSPFSAVDDGGGQEDGDE